MEGVKEIPQERFPQQTVQQFENETRALALGMLPHEKCDEACRILAQTQAELREGELMVQRT